MSTLDLDAIKARRKAVTLPPWKTWQEAQVASLAIGFLVEQDVPRLIGEVRRLQDEDRVWEKHSLVAIVTERNDLRAEVAVLEAEVERLRGHRPPTGLLGVELDLDRVELSMVHAQRCGELDKLALKIVPDLVAEARRLRATVNYPEADWGDLAHRVADAKGSVAAAMVKEKVAVMVLEAEVKRLREGLEAVANCRRSDPQFNLRRMARFVLAGGERADFEAKETKVEK